MSDCPFCDYFKGVVHADCLAAKQEDRIVVSYPSVTYLTHKLRKPW